MSKALKPFIASVLVMLAVAVMPSLAQPRATPLVVQNAWARKPPGVDTAAIYFVLKNTGAKPVTIRGVSSPVASHVMIHETTTTAEGMSRMRMRDEVVVAPGKSIAFAPEGLHVMLSGFTKDIAVGDTLPLVLQLEGGQQLSVTALVRPLDAN